MEKLLKIGVAVLGVVLLLVVGTVAKNEITAVKNPEWLVLLPYDTYMGNVWEVEELPEILDALSSRHITGLVYYPGQDIDRITKGFQGRVLLLGSRPTYINKPITWINMSPEEEAGAYVDLSFESLVKEPSTASVVKGKSVCTREDLASLVGQHLWQVVEGVYAANVCPPEALFLGYAESPSSTVVIFDVRQAVLLALDGHKVKKVIVK